MARILLFTHGMEIEHTTFMIKTLGARIASLKPWLEWRKVRSIFVSRLSIFPILMSRNQFAVGHHINRNLFPWETLKGTVVDVGGGSGHISMALARVRSPTKHHGQVLFNTNYYSSATPTLTLSFKTTCRKCSTKVGSCFELISETEYPLCSTASLTHSL